MRITLNKKCQVLLVIALSIALCGCGTKSNNYKTYEFETFDGSTVSIDDKNIISQEKVEDVLENTIVPADAEVIAPGRDYVYLADSNNYYVEDAVDQLLTIAKKND